MITWSAHLSMLFAELPFVQRPAAARAAGFAAAEIWWPARDIAGPWVAAVRAADLRITLINADAGDLAAGARGFLNVSDRTADNLRLFEEVLGLAAQVGASHINVLVGRLLADVSRHEQMATVARTLGEMGSRAAATGVTVVVEHLNDLDVPGYLLPTPRAAADLIETVAHPSVQLLYDAYHAARAGDRPVRDVTAFADLIGHVQYGDAPGRGAPGTGTTDLWAFVAALAACGYDQAIGLEYDPRGPTVPTLAFMAGPPHAAAPDPNQDRSQDRGHL